MSKVDRKWAQMNKIITLIMKMALAVRESQGM
jgi:hypothetical protein